MMNINNWLQNVLSNDKIYRQILFIIILLSGITYLCMIILILLDLVPTLVGSHKFGIGADFENYFASANAFLNGGDMYSKGYVYPPLTILFYLPLAYLSFNQGWLLMAATNFILLILTTALLIKILRHYNVTLTKSQKILLSFAIFFFYPTTSNFISGQASIAIIFLITAFYYYFIVAKDGDMGASISLGIATILKIFPFALIILPLIRRRQRFVTIYLSILVSTCVISVLLLGVPIHIRFLESLARFQEITPWYQVSLSRIFLGLPNLFNVSESVQHALSVAWRIFRGVFVFLILLYLSAVTVFKGKRSFTSEEEILIFSLILALVIALPDQTSLYYSIFLIPSYVLYIFVLKLSNFEKTLLAISLILFSFPVHALYLSKIIGGVFALLLETTTPAVYASLIFLALTLYKLVKTEEMC